MSAALKYNLQEVSLSYLATQYLQEHDGDTEEAISALIEELERNKSLLAKVARQAIEDAVRNYVTLAHRNKRAAIINSIKPHPVDLSGAVKNLVKEHRSMLLDFPLAGGVKLRDATREQVLEQAENYGKTERDASRKRVWLQSIAKFLKPKQIVGKFITEDRAIKLFEEASNV